MPPKRRAVIAGGTGVLGGHVAAEFRAADYDVAVLTRGGTGLDAVHWDAVGTGPWASTLEGADVVVNLAGSSTFAKLTEDVKQEILDSRVQSTLAIGKAIAECQNPPRAWVNASAVGYYGDRGHETLKEAAAPGEGFFADVVKAWEDALLQTPCPGTRKTWLRIGIVLGLEGGALPPMVTATKLFAGGSLGNGGQWAPWIHVRDVARLFLWCSEVGGEGSYNGCAPKPATNEEMMFTLRHVLHRPWSPPVPAAVLKLVGKVMAPDPALALISARAVPKRALEEGFEFGFPDLEGALVDLLG